MFVNGESAELRQKPAKSTHPLACLYTLDNVVVGRKFSIKNRSYFANNNSLDTPTQCKDDSLAKQQQTSCSKAMVVETQPGNIQTPRTRCQFPLPPQYRRFVGISGNSCHYVSSSLRSAGSLGCDVSTCDLNPFRYAAALLAFDIDNVRIAATSATDSVLLRCIPLRPVVVFFSSCFLVSGGSLEIGFSFQLACRRIGGAVLDSCVSVAKVTEVVDVLWREKSTSGEGVNGCITPLFMDQQLSNMHSKMIRLTLSIQNPPDRSIILKKSSYS